MTKDAIQHDPSPIRALERQRAELRDPQTGLTQSELLCTAGLASARRATNAEKFQR